MRQLAQGKKTLLAQTHDFPDPDTIASALGLTWILQELEGLETQIGYGGIIGRAENKAMIKVLKIPMRKTGAKDFDKYDLVALLDTQPDAGNHKCPPERTPDIVFDHHFKRELEGDEPRFFDVGGRYGATSTKVVELVMASGLEPPSNVATALFYGVKTDTQNLGRQASPADLAAYLYLFPRADTQLLSEIEHPQVPIDYFRIFNKAITRGKIYGAMLVSDLGEIYTPDLCAEVADRLLQVEGVKHALAVGWYEEALHLSLRTRSRQKNAGKILHSIVAKSELGTAGGHGQTAGGRIPVAGRSQRTRADLRRKVVLEVVQAFGQDHRHFQRLVSLKDASSQKIDPPPPKEEKKKNGVDSSKPAAPKSQSKPAAPKSPSKPAPPKSG